MRRYQSCLEAGSGKGNDHIHFYLHKFLGDPLNLSRTSIPVPDLESDRTVVGRDHLQSINVPGFEQA